MSVGPRFFLRTGLMRRMLKGERGRVLDVGCGDGFFLAQLVQMGFACAGLDASEQMIERCRARPALRQVELYCGVIQTYQPPHLFDVVTCGEVLEHVEDDIDALRHINQMLKPGGALVLSVPVDMALWSQADVNAGHVRRYTRLQVFDKLAHTGFTVQDYVVWGYPITRALHFRIRDQQDKLMHQPGRSQPRTLLRRLMGLGRYVFLLDNLFNFTEKGVGIIVKAASHRT